MTMGHALFDEFVRKTRDEGVEKGRTEGVEKGRTEGVEKGRTEGAIASLGRIFARKLGRSLVATERATLTERYARLGEDRLDAVVLDLSAADLAGWLADPAAR